MLNIDCTGCTDIGLSVTKIIFEDIISSLNNPQLQWLYNGYLKFRSNLSPTIINDIDNQIKTLLINTASEYSSISTVTNIIIFIALLLIIIFIFISIINNNSTISFIMLFLSLFLVIGAAVLIYFYTTYSYNSIKNNATVILENIKNEVIPAIKSGLCCIAATECGNGCTGPCMCKNIPIVTFNTIVNGLNAQFTDTTNSILPVSGWKWDFGDGTIATPMSGQTSHTYKPGTYNVTLSVNIVFFGVDSVILGPFISLPSTITIV